MEEHKLDKNLIFYNPGESGTVFTYKVGNLMNSNILEDTIDHLVYETEKEIDWVEERRSKYRPS